MALLLHRLGHYCVRRRRLVLGAWVVGLVIAIAAAQAFGGDAAADFAVPGTESQEAIDLLDERFPGQTGGTTEVVVTPAAGGTLQPDALAEIGIRLAALPEVAFVTDPATTGTISPDGTIAYFTLQYESPAQVVTMAAFEELLHEAEALEDEGYEIGVGGQVIALKQSSEVGAAESIGLLVAIVVLLVAFGSVIAMGLPLLTALIGLGIGLMAITLLANVMEVVETAPVLATMIGLAVGIDYALFIVTRHRENLVTGLPVAEAAARANATAGSAVVFAGMTVVIAIGSLAIVGIPALTGMGFASATAVFVAVCVAVTLLPALLGFAGEAIDRFTVPGMRARTSDADRRTFGNRWAATVTRHPVVALGLGVVAMLVLALPALDLRLGTPDGSSQAEGTFQRVAHELIAEGFGPGSNGPLTLVVDLADVADRDAALAEIAAEVDAEASVLAVGPPVPNADGDTAILTAVPVEGPADADTEELVDRLRAGVFPGVESETGASIALTGPTAANIDLGAKMTDALAPFVAIVIGLTLLLLMAVFRSILVPLKAAVAILLSIASSFGVVVAIFQWGWLKDLIGVDTTGPIISFLPLLMFAILFGLSMDYEVFIMTRIREEYARSGAARASVLTGLSASARVITAAAAIMVSVFGSFVLGDDVTIKMFGIGLAVAVLLDATVVRMVIVPAVLSLLGTAAWWYPRWLDRITPELDVEGDRLLETLDGEVPPDDDLGPELVGAGARGD